MSHLHLHFTCLTLVKHSVEEVLSRAQHCLSTISVRTTSASTTAGPSGTTTTERRSPVIAAPHMHTYHQPHAARPRTPCSRASRTHTTPHATRALRYIKPAAAHSTAARPQHSSFRPKAASSTAQRPARQAPWAHQYDLSKRCQDDIFERAAQSITCLPDPPGAPYPPHLPLHAPSRRRPSCPATLAASKRQRGPCDLLARAVSACLAPPQVPPSSDTLPRPPDATPAWASRGGGADRCACCLSSTRHACLSSPGV